MGGAEAMTEHLISLGHRRIAFLMGPRNMRASFDRLDGYKAALEAHAIPLSTRPGARFRIHLRRRLYRRAPAARSDPQRRPSAIFAGMTKPPTGSSLPRRKWACTSPASSRSCGYDDLVLSKSIWPGLTTVHQPAEELVEIATRLLIQNLKNRTTFPLRSWSLLGWSFAIPPAPSFPNLPQAILAVAQPILILNLQSIANP